MRLLIPPGMPLLYFYFFWDNKKSRKSSPTPFSLFFKNIKILKFLKVDIRGGINIPFKVFLSEVILSLLKKFTLELILLKFYHYLNG